MSAGERGVLQVERTKEGVPIWDGNAATFQEYSELALHWEQSVAHHKPYLCGPRLQSELTGTTRRFVMAMKPGWISYDGGVDLLLTHLRRHLGQPQLTEMSEYLGRYFKQSRRKRHESMNDYITRKGEIYARACQTLERVQQRYSPGSGHSVPGRSHPGGTATPWSQSYSYITGGGISQSGSGEAQSNTGPDDEQSFHDAEESWPNQDSWGASEWTWGSWDWSSDSQWRTQQQSSYTWEKEVTELIPTFVQGWFLLQDAGLDAQEKNMILTALKDNFSVERVAQELRNQWPDQDLRHKDQSGRSTAWTVDEAPSDDDMAIGDRQGPDMGYLVQYGMK